MKIRHSLSIFLFLALYVSCFAQVVDPEPGRLTADGPYVFHQPDGKVRMVSVGLDGSIRDTVMARPERFNVTSHDGRYSFDVPLHSHSRQGWELPAADSIFVLSDPHGRMDCLVSILQGGGVIDDKLNWSFGANRLMLIGDVMDRGDDVTQIFWLLYKLEDEARKAGGSLSMVYGNHEALVLAGDLRYCREKYKTLADTLGMTVPQLYGRGTELGNWLGGFNTIMKIGDELFVHGGLSELMLEPGMDAPTINRLCSKGIFMTTDAKAAHSDTMKDLFKRKGPVWYRGYFLGGKKYGSRMDSRTLSRICEKFGASRIFVGHTIFKNIRSMYGGRVVHIDVDAKINHDKGLDRAMLIAGGNDFVIRDSGIAKKLPRK